MVYDRTPQTSVIIASDETTERTWLELWARGDRHCPVLCSNSEQLLDWVLKNSARTEIGLVILGDPLPSQDALSLCSMVRARAAAAPVLCIRAPATPATALFEAGANDLVSRPYELEELVARARRLVRAGRPAIPMELRCGTISVDLAARRVSVAGRSVSVTPVEFDLLIYLLERRNRVVAKSTIVANVLRVYGSPENVRTHICHLREKLGAEGRSVINTVRREGYMACDLATRAAVDGARAVNCPANE